MKISHRMRAVLTGAERFLRAISGRASTTFLFRLSCVERKLNGSRFLWNAVFRKTSSRFMLFSESSRDGENCSSAIWCMKRTLSLR